MYLYSNPSKCDEIEEGFCFATLFQYQFEAEDAFLENGEKVRYGFNKKKFYDYSLRGYAELSDIQVSSAWVLLIYIYI